MSEISSRLSTLSPDIYVKLWLIEESAEFFKQFPSSWSIPPIQAQIQSKKYLESIAARFCLWELMQVVGLSNWTLKQDDRNRPYIDHPAWQISISHSFPYAAACLSRKKQIGIDVEKRHRNIQKIAPRFLNPVELNAWGLDELKLTLAWSAKESIYKAFQKPGLSFQKEIQVEMEEESIRGMVHPNDPFPISHEVFDEFVITLVSH